MTSRPSTTQSLSCRGRILHFGGPTLVMGIVNVTPDSFSDGGRFFDRAAALAQAAQMIDEGAAVIDIGGQSTRPGFTEITEEEEIARVVPLVRELASLYSVPLSIDTYKPKVARAALAAGAHILNDITGLQGNADLAAIAAEYDAPVVVMHRDETFRDEPRDSLSRLQSYFERSIAAAEAAGLRREQLVLDPGIGFFKTQQQNLELMGRLEEIRSWGFPVLLGASRKSTIGNVLNLPADQRLEGTLATTAIASWQGVDIVRVHDVLANVRVAKMVHAIRAATFS